MTRHTRGNIPPKWPILANKAWMKKRVIDGKLSDKDITDTSNTDIAGTIEAYVIE